MICTQCGKDVTSSATGQCLNCAWPPRASAWVDFNARSHRYVMDGGAVAATVIKAGTAWRGTVGGVNHYWDSRQGAQDWCDARLFERGWVLNPRPEDLAAEELRLLRRLEACQDITDVESVHELEEARAALKAFRARGLKPWRAK